MLQELMDGNFNEVVILSKQPVLIDFIAAWYGSCKMISPIIEELSEDYEGKALVVKLDIDKNPESASKYGIMSIPTLLFFKDG
jgi:thioredoxin 1